MLKITTIEEYIGILALAISTQNKAMIRSLDDNNEVDWTNVPNSILLQIDDMYASVRYLRDND